MGSLVLFPMTWLYDVGYAIHPESMYWLFSPVTRRASLVVNLVEHCYHICFDSEISMWIFWVTLHKAAGWFQWDLIIQCWAHVDGGQVSQGCCVSVFPLLLCQYDFVELLDGSRLLSKEKRSLSDAQASRGHDPSAHEGDGLRAARRARSVNVHEAGFIQFMDTGIWHLAFYNDGRNSEQVSYNTIVIGTLWRGLRWLWNGLGTRWLI